MTRNVLIKEVSEFGGLPLDNPSTKNFIETFVDEIIENENEDSNEKIAQETHTSPELVRKARERVESNKPHSDKELTEELNLAIGIKKVEEEKSSGDQALRNEVDRILGISRKEGDK